MRKRTTKIEVYKKAAEKYFSQCDTANEEAAPKISKPYTLSGFLSAVELTREQFFSLGKTRNGQRFINATLMKIEAFIEENALNGKLSASAAANSLKYSLGWDGTGDSDRENSIVVSLSENAKALGE